MLAFTARNFVSKVQPKLIFNECKRSMAVVPFKLADIGEGIAEVELMKWFIKVHLLLRLFDFVAFGDRFGRSGGRQSEELRPHLRSSE